MDLQDPVQRSLQNPAEKILQICTDSQRSKTWEVLANSAAHIAHMWMLLDEQTKDRTRNVNYQIQSKEKIPLTQFRFAPKTFFSERQYCKEWKQATFFLVGAF